MVMYASGSISKATIAELLSSMAREVEYTASVLERTLKEKGFRAEVVDKLSRQDARMLKDKAERYKERFLEYMANGRSELVGMRELYTAIALSIENSALKVDASLFRLLLLVGSEETLSDSLSERYLSLLIKVRDAAGHLTDLIRVGLSGYIGDLRKRVEELSKKLKDVEEEADAEYRRALATIVDELGSNAKSFVLFKEAVELLEDAVDLLYNAGSYTTIIALSEA
jgi:uncharacterized protein Yka (UPF0111/DUF47 family)